MAMDIDFSIIDSIEPLSGDYREKVETMSVEKEIDLLQKEIDSISTDKMPFDKYDYICIFATAIIEIFADFVTCDPTKKNSLASKFNDGKNPLGEWCNKYIHEAIDHTNNPLDFQGKFDEFGNQILGEGHTGQTISFGGGNHRQLTYGHDLLRFFHALKEYKEGKFMDGGFINIDGKSIFVEVSTKLNVNGNAFSTQENPLWGLICHLFADFWSTRGLPIPGWSFLSHSSNREIRQWAADMYADGFNLRTEMLKNLPVALGEFIIRVYCYARFRDKDQAGKIYRFNNIEYSKEAYRYKRKQMLLFSHAIALSFSVGKAVMASNPLFVNIAMILRVCQLSLNLFIDEVNYNHRVFTKITLEQYKARLEQSRYIVISLENIYYTANYQRLITEIKSKADELIKLRLHHAEELMDLQTKYNSSEIANKYLMQQNNEEILDLTKGISVVIDPDITLEELVEDSEIEPDMYELKELVDK